MLYLISIYSALFIFLAWKKFNWAILFFILALPTYLIRFSIGPLPTTLLEVNFGAIFLVWVIKYFKRDWEGIKNTIRNNKIFFIFLTLFFVASLFGILVSDMWWASLGQWRAYFLEPILFLVILLGRKDEFDKKDIIWYLLLSSLSVSLVAIGQKITGQLYPPSLWNSQLIGRATSFFTSPNAVGLFLVPIFLLSMAVWKRQKIVVSAVIYLALLAILFSFSQGAWIALGAGVICFIYLMGYKKITALMVILAIFLSLIIAPIRTAVLFQDKASQNRLTLWRHSWTYLTSSPSHFFLGAGIRQYFRKVEKPYYNPEEMERLIYPHNILLNFWMEIGLLGMLGFVGLLIYWRMQAQKIYRKDKILGAALIVGMIGLTIQGLVDVPYFKNDLAFLFWIVCSLIFI